MLKKYFLHTRYALPIAFVLWFLILSTTLRLILFAWAYRESSHNLLTSLGTLLTGLVFDIGTISFIVLPALIYYLLIPNKWHGNVMDRFVIWFFAILLTFLLVFTFVAEITFWDEFKSRFNFIAVDYLVYTYEVISNIQESYPLPMMIICISIFVFLVLLLFYKIKAFTTTFTQRASLKDRSIATALCISVCIFFTLFIKNADAEWSSNRYNAEIAKSGIYSFFAAFRNNQLTYGEFYTTISDKDAFDLIKHKLNASDHAVVKDELSIHRTIQSVSDNAPIKPNVILILVESLSASFMKEFGDTNSITPFLDSVAQRSICFKNLYATGNRTVRGMEAMTLSIPPTPGQSIVKRPENQDLFTVSNVFKSKSYQSNFFYGGDGYFDNMNAYFGGNGFTIYDRGRGSILGDYIKTTRHHIADNEVTFENAWGICDDDIFSKMTKVADEHYKLNELFFNFVMTTSNHRPYTYPGNAIDVPSGTGRNGAVKYTDYAISKMLEAAKSKPWFKNTVFIIIADHCASSAGKDEIDIENYHIPALIINLPEKMNQKIEKLCSQIDLFPTFFSMLNWNYESDFFGEDVLSPGYEERALVGTYRKLALIKKDKVMILSDQKKQSFYSWSKTDNSLRPLPMDNAFLKETISWYQTADYLFTNRLLK